jgi:hypothetical protein
MLLTRLKIADHRSRSRQPRMVANGRWPLTRSASTSMGAGEKRGSLRRKCRTHGLKGRYWRHSAHCSAPGRPRMLLETIPSAENAPLLAAFGQRLRQLGYVEGQNYEIEYRSADGRGDRFPHLVMELIQAKVDIIVLRGTPAAVAAKNATSTIPIVITAIGDPLLVVASLSHPGGNLTGLSSFLCRFRCEATRVAQRNISSDR